MLLYRVPRRHDSTIGAGDTAAGCSVATGLGRPFAAAEHDVGRWMSVVNDEAQFIDVLRRKQNDTSRVRRVVI